MNPILAAQPPRTEEQLVQDILYVLNMPAICPLTFAYRQETRGIPRPIRQEGRIVGWKAPKANAGERGKADIAGVKDGRGFVMEVKLPTGRLEPHQADWLKDYMERGRGKAFVVRSVQEALDAWKEI